MAKEWTLDHTGLTADEQVLRKDGTPVSPNGFWSFDQRTGSYRETRSDGRRLGIQATPVRRGMSRLLMSLNIRVNKALERALN